MSKFSASFNVDSLFPSDTNISGTRGKHLDIETLFTGGIEDDPDISFTSDVLINRIQQRRKKKLWCFRNMLRYCYERIQKADDDQLHDIIFNVIEIIPDCKEYTPAECIDYISKKLTEQKFDVLVLNHTSIFISWKYIELKKEDERLILCINKTNKNI